MSHKVVTERMVYMVTEYEFYEELKDAVENGLRNDIENLSVRIIERREFEKTDFKLCLAVLCGSVVELRVMADEWYDPAAQKFDFSGLLSKIRDALDKIYDRYGLTGSEPGKFIFNLSNGTQIAIVSYCDDIRRMYHSLIASRPHR